MKREILLEHFCLWVDEVIAPIFKHPKNIGKFPHCIAKGNEYNKSNNKFYIRIVDIKKQVHELCTTVYQIKGYMRGKTLLPFPEVFENAHFLELSQHYRELMRLRMRREN